jgi:hypothetical protein
MRWHRHQDCAVAAKAKIDTARKERGQRAKLFSNHQRRMVRQHDAARADADRRSAIGDIADHDRCGGAGNAGHIVMFSQPIAMKAKFLRMLCKLKRVAQRLTGIAVIGNGRKIEYG